MGSRTVQYSATQAYQLGRAADTSVRSLVDFTDKKELFGGAQSQKTSLTKHCIRIHVLPFYFGMKTVLLKMTTSRSPSTRVAAEGASAAAKSAAARSSQDASSDE